MFNVPRPIVAVIAALAVAWLLPQLVDYWLNDETAVVASAVQYESATQRLAKGE